MCPNPRHKCNQNNPPPHTHNGIYAEILSIVTLSPAERTVSANTILVVRTFAFCSPEMRFVRKMAKRTRTLTSPLALLLLVGSFWDSQSFQYPSEPSTVTCRHNQHVPATRWNKLVVSYMVDKHRQWGRKSNLIICKILFKLYILFLLRFLV
jgi:hypothetical protein